MKRAIVIVLDGCGAGEAPDASEFNDFDHPSTIKHVWDFAGLVNAPKLIGSGFFTACGVEGLQPGLDGFQVRYGRLQEMSRGKDSVTGHWEMMGIHTDVPFPTYPGGFPADLVKEFESLIGRKVLGNKPASGTAILDELGEAHVESGSPILYTSADSVFQIACHEDVVPIEKLYEICRIGREVCQGENNVQRVIARPFVGTAGAWVRTERRKDFPLSAPKNLVDDIGDVYGVGVVPELFDERGFRATVRTQNNSGHATALWKALESDARFIFANFEDFDMLFGHRNDPAGFARCLEEFDPILATVLPLLTEDDLLILTADHGNDPTSASTDHSREFVPLVQISKGERVSDLGDSQGMWKVGDAVRSHLSL